MTSSARSERRKKKFENKKQSPEKNEKVKWSKKSILLFSTFGLALVFFIGIVTSNDQMSDFFSFKNKSDYSTTNATVYFYETKSMMTQSKYGSSNQITGYLVKYRYQVNGKTFDNEEILNLNTKPKFILDIVNNLNSDSFIVEYEISNPENSNLIQSE